MLRGDGRRLILYLSQMGWRRVGACIFRSNCWSRKLVAEEELSLLTQVEQSVWFGLEVILTVSWVYLTMYLAHLAL